MRKGAKTNRSGKVLEYVFEQLAHYGFQQINGNKLDDLIVYPSRFVHTHSKYNTIFETVGYHEGLIVADKQNGQDFLEYDWLPSGRIMIVVECKFQSGSGSVDEKIPYIIESFKESQVGYNWVLVLDGNWWTKNARGQAVVQYAKVKATQFNNEERRLLVLSRHEFKELVMRAWGKTNG